jgi:tripeptide aminopeptidase
MEPIDHLNQTLPWQGLDELATWTITQAKHIQQIAAPTFQEAARAAYVAEQFRTLGLQQVEIDDLHNVYGTIIGTDPATKGIMLSAHTDTVFPIETDLALRQSDGQVHGAGIGDNSTGVAGLLAAAHYLRQHNITPPVSLHIVAPSREEGLGDLGGMRAAFARLQAQLHSVINLEGMAFGYIYNAGIAVRRLHIRAHTGGGHSWLHFGRPSAIHGIISLGARLLQLNIPAHPRTTYNIGIIEGGQSINTIAAEAGLWLDLRSEEMATLQALEAQVRQAVLQCETSDLRFTIEVVGDRPAGSIADTHPLVLRALSALHCVGVRGHLENGSTDANIPLALGCPAVTVGVTRGANGHRLDEYIETAPVADGLHHILLLTLATAHSAARLTD